MDITRGNFWEYLDRVYLEVPAPEGVTVDTVISKLKRPVFSAEPDMVKRRLRIDYPDNWEKVLIGETEQIVTILEYLYEDKYNDILAMLKELLRKQDAPLFRRDPERLNIYLEAAAKRIIERVLGD